VQDFYFDARNPANIYLGMNDETLFVSRDHGKTLNINTGIRHIHDGRINIGNALVVDTSASPNTLFLGALTWIPQIFRGGVYKSVDDGTNWIPINNGLPDARVYALAQHSGQKKLLLAGIAKHGFFRTTDGGNTWTACNNGISSPETLYSAKLDTGAGRQFGFRADIVFDPKKADTVYVTAGEPAMIYKSMDNGEHWQTANHGLHSCRVYALRMNSDDPRRLYAACGPEGLYQSDDGGAHWAKTGDFPCHFMDLSKQDAKLVIAGTHKLLRKSYDGGQSWVKIETPTVLTWLASARFDPTDPNTLFVGTFSNGALKGVRRQVQ